MAEYIDRNLIEWFGCDFEDGNCENRECSGCSHAECSHSQVMQIPTANVIEVPEDATNGDMVKAMFPNTSVCNTFPSLNNDEVYYIFISETNGATNEMRVMKSWWDAPYKRK